jgi:hypothetical protein
MIKISIALILETGVLLLLPCASWSSTGPTDAEIRSAFTDIRSDNIPHNCVNATNWLFTNREQIKDELVSELYKTDRQGRDAILHVLFKTKSFVPDERFIQLVMSRLSEQDKYVENLTIFDPAIALNEEPGADQDETHAAGAHWEAWPFINKHFDAFEPSLKEEIGKTDNVFVLWATAWLLKKRGILQNYTDLYTPAVLSKAVQNLKNDNQGSNASHAVRLFLLLGDQSLPTLREAAHSSDRQCSNLARATIDALAGNHAAFGYLCSKLNITRTPFGPEVPEPEWLADKVVFYLDRDDYP